MSDINIFDSAKPQGGEFFKFKNVGDAVQGTYVDSRTGTDSFNNQQTIYVIQDKDGKIWNLGFADRNLIIHERMAGIRMGQIVGFRYDEERESKKNPGTKAKIIRIYADPKAVDNEWLAEQKRLNELFGGPAPKAVTEVAEDELDFNQPVDEEGDLQAADEKPQKNEALSAIRTLAMTKGLTNEIMLDSEADEAIEKFAGLPLTEENLTKIIIKLTGYTSK